MLNSSLYNLTRKIFDGYSPYIRPVKNPHTITDIKLDLTLQQVISMVCIIYLNYMKFNLIIILKLIKI